MLPPFCIIIAFFVRTDIIVYLVCAQNKYILKTLTFLYVTLLKMTCSQFKGWSQLNHQPILKFPHFFPAGLQAKTEEILKLLDYEAGLVL